MLNTLFAKIASVLAVPLVVILSLAGYNLNQPQTDYSAFIKSEIERYAKESQTLGADNVLPVGGATYNLSGAGISSSATSFTLASFTLPQNGYKLTDADVAPGSSQAYFTLEPGNRTRQEFVGCTTVVQNVSGTATISGCTRGLSPIQPYTASTSLQFAHSGAAQVILSNPPQQQNLYAAKDNDETITGIWTYASTSPARYASCPAAHLTGAAASTTAELASLCYVNAISIAGAPDASETAQGVVELATQSEAASSTSSGTEARLVLPASMATDTPNTATKASRVLMSDMLGFIKQGWLDLTATFAWSGVHTWSSAGSYLFSNGLAKLGVGTSSPVTAFEVGSSGVFGDNLRAGTFTATSTTATSTFPNIQATTNATTTSLFVSGACTGCPTTYSASSTSFSVTSGTINYLFSIPTTTNMGIGSYTITGNSAGQAHKGTFIFTRTGLTTFALHYAEGSADTDLATYTFTWSGGNLSIEETTDANANTSITGTVFWYK